MKLGWIVVSGPEPLRSLAQERLEYIADAYLSVGAPIQHAAARMLRERAQFFHAASEGIATNLADLQTALASHPEVRVLKIEGGWYVILRLPPPRTDEAWALELLEKDNVLVQPGYLFGFEEEGHLVLSLLTPMDEFLAGVRRMTERFATVWPAARTGSTR